MSSLDIYLRLRCHTSLGIPIPTQDEQDAHEAFHVKQVEAHKEMLRGGIRVRYHYLLHNTSSIIR